MAKTRTTPMALSEALVADAEAAVRRTGFVVTKKLVTGKLARRDEILLVEKLVARGLERTPRGVRAPLADQVLKALDETRGASLPALAKRVSGATQAEIKREAIRLVDSGALSLVAGARGDQFMHAGAHVLASHELEALRDASKSLAKLVTRLRARKGMPQKTLERAELSALLEGLLAIGVTSKAGARLTPSRLLAALDDLAAARGRSVFIPDVIRTLGADGEPLRAQAHEALFELARAGRVELRPESGVNSLPDQDRALCPSDAAGTLISYARVIDGAEA
jgi:hypothetical protein